MGLFRFIDDVLEGVVELVVYPFEHFSRKRKREQEKKLLSSLQEEYNKPIEKIIDMYTTCGENKYRITFSDGQKLEINK